MKKICQRLRSARDVGRLEGRGAGRRSAAGARARVGRDRGQVRQVPRAPGAGGGARAPERTRSHPAGLRLRRLVLPFRRGGQQASISVFTKFPLSWCHFLGPGSPSSLLATLSQV